MWDKDASVPDPSALFQALEFKTGYPRILEKRGSMDVAEFRYCAVH